MSYVITKYDISGIQSFIFSSKGLKERVGASKIIHNILYTKLPEELNTELPEELKQESDAWLKDGYDFMPAKNESGRVIYIGGGNAMVIFRDMDSMRKVTRKIQEEIFNETYGKIRLCHAEIEIDKLDVSASDLLSGLKGKNKDIENYKDEGAFGIVYNLLNRNLIKYKEETLPVRTARGFSINAYNSEASEPVTASANNGCTELLYSAEGIQKKLSAYSDHKKEIIDTDGTDDYKFSVNFEALRQEGKKSFIAVVHIDGNSMGSKIIKLNRGNSDKSLKDGMDMMRKFSACTDTLYRDTLKATIDDIFKDNITDKKELGFRPLIVDGDDTTFIIKSDYAFDFVEKYVKNLEELGEKYKNDPKFDFLKKYNFKFSVGAGIAFVPDKYPFENAYDMAEQLCKNAKKQFANSTSDVSSMDFQIIHEGIRTELRPYRERNYKKTYDDGSVAKEYYLNERPYAFSNNTDNTELNNYGDFKKLREKVKSGKLARNKLKRLRDAFGEGYIELLSMTEFLLSRKKDILSEDINKKIQAINTSIKNKKPVKTVLFDVLDSMEF